MVPLSGEKLQKVFPVWGPTFHVCCVNCGRSLHSNIDKVYADRSVTGAYYCTGCANAIESRR